MDRRRALMSVHTGTDTPIAPPEPIIDINNYLTIEALEHIYIEFNSNGCEYCVNGDGNWITYNRNELIEIPRRCHVSFRGNLTGKAFDGIGSFYIDGKCNLKGNCMSMLFKDNAANNYSLSGKSFAFCKLFKNCTNIVNVSNNFLPATILGDYCYYDMFENCDSLTTAPELPATTLAEACYYYMFSNCRSLTTAPELPATILKFRCYDGMFDNCRSLTTAPALPATTLADSCYDCMFNECDSLTTAPVLPATILKDCCYSYMFKDCGKLNYIKMLATNISANDCLYAWVNNVSSSGTFVKNHAMTTLPTGHSGIPEGWTVVDDGEESSGDLITFTVGDTEYQAEEGMTWGEWVNSEYNVNGEFSLDIDDSIMYGDYDYWVGTEEDYVYTSDIIQENYNYLLVL